MKTFKEVINTIQSNEIWKDIYNQVTVSMDQEGYISIESKGLSILPNNKMFLLGGLKSITLRSVKDEIS